MSHIGGSRLILRALASASRSSLPRCERTSTHRALCQGCMRPFSTTQAAAAGHNKWSKTKHIKAVTDKKKTANRSEFSKLIALYSRLYGDDIKFNPQLANAISAATKASVPKAVIDNAIARGQGRSATGAQLEALTLEFLYPPDIALVIEVETESKNRSLQELRSVVKRAGGLIGSSSFYFTRRGQAIFSPKSDGPTITDVLEEAIEHEGTEDVEELDDGNFAIYTEPAMLMAVTQSLSKKFAGLELLESEIVWAPNEDTRVAIDSDDVAQSLSTMFASLKEHQEVKGLYANVRQGSIADEQWESIERNLEL